METLKLTLVQADLSWENRQANLTHLDHLIDNTARETDIILLPEMFSTGFSMDPGKLWDSPEGETLQWMLTRAEEKDSAICGSIIVKDKDKFYNRLYFVTPAGEYYTYNKRHLFTLAGEERVYSPGEKKLIVNYRGWQITPLICYDLRFPVWCRNAEHSDLMLFVANWPERRSEAWRSLLKARAIENMCFVAGLNRIGFDGNKVYHDGSSGVYDELGNLISNVEPGKEQVQTVVLDKEKMKKSRERFGFLNDADPFKVL